MSRRQFSPEFKHEAVKLVLEHNRSATAVAHELGIAQSSVSAWVRQAQATPSAPALSEPERRELASLRRELRVLRMERDLLKRAAAYFAKERA